MFEKEAEEWVKKEFPLLEVEHTNLEESITEYRAYKDGAEFGYNKANEWHYVKDGDLPKSEGSYYVAMDNGRGYKSGAILNWVEETDCEEDFHWEDDDYECFDEQVYAWKEIVLPVLPEESEQNGKDC